MNIKLYLNYITTITKVHGDDYSVLITWRDEKGGEELLENISEDDYRILSGFDTTFCVPTHPRVRELVRQAETIHHLQNPPERKSSHMETLDIIKKATKGLNLQSSVNNIAEATTQIFHFVGNVKRTFSGIISSEIKEGEMLKLKLKDGRMLIINKANLLMTEVFAEENNYEKENEEKQNKKETN